MAPFTLFVFALCSPRFGAALTAPGHAFVTAGGGVNGFLPVGAVGLGAGVVDRVDLSATYEVHAGIVHVFGVGSRLRIARGLALGLFASDGLYAIEQLGGLTFARAPFGSGLSLAPSLEGSWTTQGGVSMSLGAGVTFGLVALHESFGTVDRRWDPSVKDARAEITAEWPGESGATYLLFRAVVPIEADLRVLGYLPMVALGRTWGLP